MWQNELAVATAVFVIVGLLALFSLHRIAGLISEALAVLLEVSGTGEIN